MQPLCRRRSGATGPRSVPGVVLVAVVGLLAIGCGSASPAAADPRKVDMCTILTDPELSRFGIQLDTRTPVEQLGSVGCEWTGTRFTLSLERDQETVAAYKARPRGPEFIIFAENTVNGRAGVRFGVDGDGCEQLIDGGPVSLVVNVASTLRPDAPQIDSCAEALRIAQLVEPRLPKPRG